MSETLHSRTAGVKLGTADSACREVRLFDVSPDGKNLAYAGPCTVGSDTLFGLWQDGALVTVADRITDLQFTSQGELWFVAAKDGQAYVFLAGKTGPLYERVSRQSIINSPDGTTIAYAACRNGKWRVITQAAGTASRPRLYEGKEYAGVGLPFFGNDGRTLIYPAFAGGQFGPAKRFVVTGTQEGKMYVSDYLGWVKKSPDGARLAYVVAQDGKAFVVENERAGTKYDDVGWLQFTPGSPRLVYAAKAHGQYSIVRDGYPLRDHYDDISFPAFSTEGSKLAFVARAGNKEFVVTGGLRGPRFDQILLPQFSPNGRRLGYIARQGNKWYAVIDSRAGRPYDEVSWLLWSPASTDYAYRARIGNKYRAILNGAESQDFDEIGRVQFSLDGSGLSYAARQGRSFFLQRD